MMYGFKRISRDMAQYYMRSGYYSRSTELRGRTLEALQQTVGQMDPQTLGAMNTLAWDLAGSSVAELRDGSKAVALSTRLCELTEWRQPQYMDTLAAAFAETGDFESAIKWQERAVSLLHDDQNRREYEDRLRLFQSRRPYRQPAFME